MPATPLEMTEEQWAAVRAAYEGEIFTIDEITEQFGMSRTRLYRRAAMENWATRRDSPLVPRRAHPQPHTGTPT